MKLYLAILLIISPIVADSKELQNVYIGEEVRELIGFGRSKGRWHVGPPNSWPESVWRELQFTRTASIDCTTATNALAMRESIEEALLPVTVPPKSVVIRDYVLSCLTPLESVSDEHGGYSGQTPENSKFLMRVTSKQEAEALRNSIVVFPGITGKPCSGTIIQIPKGQIKRAILTAAHCLGSTSTGSDASKILGISRRISIDDINGNRATVEVRRPVRRVEYDPIEDDIALIALDGELEASSPGLPVATVQFSSFDHIYLVGQNEVLREHRNFLAKDEQYRRTLPTHNTIVAFGPLCRAHGQFDNVLLHNCQTRWGSSGAAMMVVQNGRFVVFGVHTGTSFTTRLPQLSNSSAIKILQESRARNYGILLGGK